MKAGLLFDLDGTLVDTEAEHFAAFAQIFGGYGVALDALAYAACVMGFPNAMIAAAFLPMLSPADGLAALARKEEVYRARLGALSPLPGLHELLASARASGIGCAVVTNAPRANAELVLGRLGLSGAFDSLVIADELAHSKPHPLPYLTGLERLGAAAARSLAFEDSRSGIRSAVAAGIRTVGLTTTLEAAEILRLGAVAAARDFRDARIDALMDGTDAVAPRQ